VNTDKKPPGTTANEVSPIAAVDLGSNSFRLVVAQQCHGELRLIERTGEKTQLAAGLNDSRLLDNQAMERGWECLSRMAQYCKALPAGAVRAVGTSILRKAENSAQFVRKAEEILGHPVDVISGKEEARLIYLGVAHTHAADCDHRLVIDVGGDSTECIAGENFQPHLLESLDMGCISGTRTWFPDGKITRDSFDKAYYAARLELAPVESQFRSLGWKEATGSSSSIKTLYNILRELGYDSITRKGLAFLKTELLRCKRASSLSLPTLKPDRATIFPGALVIVCALFDSLDIDSMSFSSGALREGILYDMIGRNSHEDVCLRTLSAMQERYGVDIDYSIQVKAHLSTLLATTRHAWKLTPQDEQLVHGAAMVHEIGMTISHHQFHRHGAYILSNADMLGFTRRQQEHMALLVQGHRRTFPVQALLRLDKDGITLSRLMVLLRLAILLSQRYGDRQMPACTCQVSGSRVCLSFPDHWLANNPLTHARCKKEQQLLVRAGYNLVYR